MNDRLNAIERLLKELDDKIKALEAKVMKVELVIPAPKSKKAGSA
jgi:hypothetical protein